MAKESAVSSLLHELIAAHRTLSEAVSSQPKQRTTNAIFEAVRAFVFEWRKVPAWSAELDRRATFIERGCADGSAWKRAALDALAVLPDSLETNDPREALLSKAGIGAPHYLRCLVDTGVVVLNQLREVIDALDRAQKGAELAKPTQVALEKWRRLSNDLYDQAVSLKADGCRLLDNAYGDLIGNPTAQSGTTTVLKAVPGMFRPVHEAADSLMGWATQHPAPAGDAENPPEAPTHDTPEVKPVVAGKQVQLFGPGEQPMVKGKQKSPLSKAAYDVVRALIQAGENGLTKDRLDTESKHGDARKVMKRLADGDRDWKAVLVFPGKPGRGYRIR